MFNRLLQKAASTYQSFVDDSTRAVFDGLGERARLEVAEGMLAVMLLAGHADGEFSTEEHRQFKKVVEGHPLLTQVDAKVVGNKVSQLLGMYFISPEDGDEACLDELRQVVGKDVPMPQREAILRAGMGVALASPDEGGLRAPSGAEKAALLRAAAELGITDLTRFKLA